MIPDRPQPRLRKPTIPTVRGDEPHVAVKRALAEAVMRVVEVNRISATAAAYTAFGVSQSRFSDLRHGRIHRFTVDSLINMLAHAGYVVTVDVSEAPERRIGRRRRRRRDLARGPASGAATPAA